MDRVGNNNKIEQASLLLPWYVTGKLSLLEEKEVEDCLVVSASLRQELVTERELSARIHSDPDVLDIMAITTEDQRLDGLLEKINRYENEKVEDTVTNKYSKKSFSWSGLFSKLSILIVPSSVSWKNIAIAVFLLAQVSIISVVLMNTSNKVVDYELAADRLGNTALSKHNTVLIIQFRTNVTQGYIKNIFKRIGVKSFTNPSGSTNYRVIMNKKYTKTSIKKLLSKLNKNESILLAGLGY